MAKRYRAWYTHEDLELTLKEIQKYAKQHHIKLKDPDNPTQEELRAVYMATFEEMSDPWEITANGRCKVQVSKNK